MDTVSLRERIEERTAELVSRFVDAREACATDRTCAQVMADTAAQAVTSGAGGKCLRALLAMDMFAAAADATPDGASWTAMLDLACAIEVFQTAALVHDDIIDDSDLRRGRPAAHRALGETTHDARLGTGLGIMLGDLLATDSVAIAQEAARRLAGSDGIVRTFLTMHREVEIGQVLDLGAALCPLDDPGHLADTALNVFRWKTASYTTIAPIELALLAAGTPPDVARGHALAVGAPLGLAFQLTDDLLDVIGSSSDTGKPVGGDIREGKRTVLLADALERLGADERRELTAIFTSPERGDAEVARAIALFESSGAVQRSRERIARLWEQARGALDGLGLDARGMARAEGACARFVPTI